LGVLSRGFARAGGATLGVALLLAGGARPEASKPSLSPISKEERLSYLRRAQVWRRTDIPSLDLRQGPPGGFAPEQDVACDYVVPEKKLAGTSPKFDCALAPGEVVKVKYGDANGEVFAAVAASRLFWALGFGADAVYRVRVTCRNCPADPWKASMPRLPAVVFENATIERKLPGEEIAHEDGEGWGWDELAVVDPSEGGAPLEQRDALTLLAVFVQHTDNKKVNQRLVCLPEGLDKEAHASCTAPFLVTHDLGSTFGHGGLFGAPTTGSADFKAWSSLALWESPQSCRTHLGGNITFHTLKDPVISEAGRVFLADLLAQLSDGQIRDLFTAARIDRRGWHSPKDEGRNGTIDQWVAAFKTHRAEVLEHTCPPLPAKGEAPGQD
jgi:hypothetical protein